MYCFSFPEISNESWLLKNNKNPYHFTKWIVPYYCHLALKGTHL